MEIHDIALVIDGQTKVRRDVRRPGPSARIRSQDLYLFSRTLSGLLDGGVPILRALEGLERVAADKALKNMLAGLVESLRRGDSFSESLEKSGAVPVYFSQTVYGGEIAGRVPAVLQELSKYLEKEAESKRSIRDALIYPLFIVGMGIVTLGVLTGFVLPRLQSVYATFNAELPWVTKWILELGRFYLPGIALTAFVGVVLSAHLRNQGTLDRILYKVPLLGDFFKGYVRVRFSRLLALLLESGVPVLEALSVVEKTSKTPFFRDNILFIKSSLAAGGGFSGCLGKIDWMDPVSRMLVIAGEETGRLGRAFFQIARGSEEALEARIKLAVKLLEPTLILVMGLVVGFVVMGTVLPIFDMSGVVH